MKQTKRQLARVHLLDFEGMKDDGTPNHVPSPCGIAPEALIEADNWSDDLGSITCRKCHREFDRAIRDQDHMDRVSWEQEIRMQERMGGINDD